MEEVVVSIHKSVKLTFDSNFATNSYLTERQPLWALHLTFTFLNKNQYLRDCKWGIKEENKRIHKVYSILFISFSDAGYPVLSPRTHFQQALFRRETPNFMAKMARFFDSRASIWGINGLCTLKNKELQQNGWGSSWVAAGSWVVDIAP